jgi:diguanylate cyclase (GGDEF)-like protein
MSLLTENIKRMKLEIASARKRTKRLESELLKDPLTNIHSRRAYERHIEQKLKAYYRDQHGFSMLVLDIDSFKHINERYGHDVGDICLKGLSRRIIPLLGDTGFLARFEGDVFVIILQDAPLQDARKTAEKIRAHIEKTDFLHKKEQVRVTLSIGVAEAAPGDQSPADLFGRAESALFRAKEEGRNRVAVAATDRPG